MEEQLKDPNAGEINFEDILRVSAPRVIKRDRQTD